MTCPARQTSCRIVLLAMLILPGCASFGNKPAPLEMAGGNVEKAKLSYRVSTSSLNALQNKLPEAAGAAAQLVAYEATSAALKTISPLPPNADATVEIAYPHPDGKPGLAQVKVRIEVRPVGKLAEDLEQASRIKRWWLSAKEKLPGLKGSTWSQETWLMDLPQDELCTAMGQLRSTGYFEGFSLPGGAKIEVTLDDAKTNKQWNQSPAFDALVLRARREGRLVSSTKPPTSKQPAETVAVAKFEIERLPPVR